MEELPYHFIPGVLKGFVHCEKIQGCTRYTMERTPVIVEVQVKSVYI